MCMNRGLYVLILSLGIVISGCELNPPPDSKPEPQPSADAQTSWSPDGQTIAVAWGGHPGVHKRGIYLIDTLDWSVEELLVVENDAFFSSPSWSATGEWLVFATNAHIYKIKKNGDSLTQLTFNNRHWICDWSNSDTLIVYNISIGDSGGVWLMKTDGSNKSHLVRYGSHLDFVVGDSILFIESLPSNRDFSHMVLINPVDSSTREIYRWEKGKPYHVYYEPKVSPDGKTVALFIQTDVWTLTIEGENLRRLTFDGSRYPNWSPDGKKIVYCKPNMTGGTIWIMNADGSEKTQVEGW